MRQWQNGLCAGRWRGACPTHKPRDIIFPALVSAHTMSSSDDEVALLKRPRPAANAGMAPSSDEDVPLSQLPETPKKKTKVKKERSEDGKKRRKKTHDDGKRVKKHKKEPKAAKEEKKTAKKPAKTAVKDEPLTQIVTPLTGTSQDEKPAEDDDGGYKWWEDENLGGDQKWQSLEHNGVIFPPEYEPLPAYVKLFYDGKPVDLPVQAEEVAGFFGAMLESDHTKNPVFQKNFFDDFCEVLKDCGGCNVDIASFDKMDFTKIHAYYEKQREEKKALPSDEKKRIKAEKDKLEEPYKTCMLNGRKEQVGNFRVEPPGLFRGRGAHPKTGKFKKRVFPEDITLNLSEGAKVPEPPAGHQWGEIRHDQTVTWLAMWKENIADSLKYVKFAANSSVKGVSDFKKFETARNLRQHISAIRSDYDRMLKDQLMQNRQMATATYLIDIFALRAGGEKGEDEADTVGCCSLRYEHVTLKPPNTVIFDFLGKDSIRFYQEVEVDKQVFKNLRIFKKDPKQPGDNLFDRITPTLLNKHFQNYMKGLTAKVFRTYNASKTMQDQLDLIPNEGTVAEKVVKFNAANRTVAILCNHQRTVSKGHGSLVQKINEKLQELLWQKLRLKKMILDVDPAQKKKNAKYFEEIDDLSKEDTSAIHHRVIERMKEQATKRFERENQKLKVEEKPLMTDADLKTKMDAIEDTAKEYANELKTGKVEAKKGATVEKLTTQIEAIENRIVNTSFQLKDKEDNSEVSLGTSKMNYIDPRLTVVFSKKFNVPIEKLFTKTLRDKFKWAIESADENWRF